MVPKTGYFVLFDRVVMTGQQLLLRSSLTFLRKTDLQLNMNLIIMHLQTCITFRIIYYGIVTMQVCYMFGGRGQRLWKLWL